MSPALLSNSSSMDWLANAKDVAASGQGVTLRPDAPFVHVLNVTEPVCLTIELTVDPDPFFL